MGALRHLKKLVKVVAAGLGEGHPALASARMSLADCTTSAKSYRTAKNTFARLLQTKLPTEDEAHARLHMAVARAHLGEGVSALEQIHSAKRFVAKHFGTHDIRYAKALNGCAGVFQRLDRDEEAFRN